MRTHHITASILSLANPWLDFLPPGSAPAAARTLNNELSAISAAHPGVLYAFAALPLTAPVADVVAEVRRVKGLQGVKGVIMGTTGLGRGLDDEGMGPVWAALEETGLLVFLHPHYGVPGEVYGPRAGEYGHVLPLAVGFPMETTVAFARMYLGGVFERWAGLKVLLAHSGGAVPFLAGRIESCVRHERTFRNKEGKEVQRRGIWEVLRGNVWLDAVVYSEVGLKAAVEAVGKERVLFGTDRPFFPPLDDEEGEGVWPSVRMNVDAVRGAFGDDEEAANMVLGGNAVELLKL
ncbi:uracil-5-carboxylate decarboxylase [Lasallia pustulata]|uniref:Uracil-5-carboxylate decarboxylase n=1 Tax=Lasallia pustulata TaxID=136370 RepID=A0A1W5D026_9LECA|nr:uracil-5-carboxylate decarboxylase [Lasallia pustulata]